MKFIAIIIVGLEVIWWLMFQLLDVKKLRFPVVHPTPADRIGFKYEKIDEYENNRIYCYGFLYNGWLE